MAISRWILTNIALAVKEKMLDSALKMCIAVSQRIFMVRDCWEWLYPTCV